MFFEYGYHTYPKKTKFQKIKKKGQVFQTRRANSFYIKLKKPIQRMSSGISSWWRGKKRQGSLTIEAAIALPLFLLASLMILSVVDMMRSYIQQEEKLYEQVRQMSVYASVPAGGEGTKYIEMTLPKVVSPKIKGPGYQSLIMVNHCKVRVWNGYQGDDWDADEHEEGYVYITKEGSVYHKKRDCSHLNLTINKISGKSVLKERNADGEKYKGCKHCAKGLSRKELSRYQLFITPYGNRYHTSMLCSDLIRTVEVVPKKSITDMPLCKDCAK